MSDKNKFELLRRLEEELAADTHLPLQQSNLVFGEGNIDCEVMFIGEAPGANEDRERRPFVGRGGQLLTKMIEKIGWKRQDVYITNIVKRRPPDNRDPLPEEIAAYTPYLTRQINIIDPALIVTLGRFSMNYFLPEAKITRDQGTAFRTQGRIIVPFFHPAAALRGTGVMKQFEAGFLKLPVLIKKIKNQSPKDKKEISSSNKPSQAKLFQ